MDVFWFGVLNGSIIIFLAVYISRLGATTFQTGLLTALPALGNLIFSIPAGRWGLNRPTYQVTRWAWLSNRLFYALLIPIPVLFPDSLKIWVILGIVLVMTIPGTVAVVFGNAFFAETVPLNWRGQVVGIRNALLALSTMLTSLLVGQILKRFAFETGYQIVFTIGFVGSMMSCLHLFLVRPVPGENPPHTSHPDGIPRNTGLRLEILSSPFRKVLLATLVLQVAVFIPNPIFPLYQVNILKLSDETISLGSSVFWVIYFLASTQAHHLTRRLGFRNLSGIGMSLTSFSTLLFTLSFQPWIYGITQIFGGIAWAIYGNGFINYVLENVPAEDRPAHMVWYNLAVNSATLLSGLLAPQITNQIGLTGGMILAVILRLLAGFSVLRWG